MIFTATYLPFLALLVLGFSLVAVHNLSKAMKHRYAWLMTLGAFVPYLGFFVLLWLNNAATKHLQKAGLTVGLMGVSNQTLSHLDADR